MRIYRIRPLADTANPDVTATGFPGNLPLIEKDLRLKTLVSEVSGLHEHKFDFVVGPPFFEHKEESQKSGQQKVLGYRPQRPLHNGP